MATGMTNFSRLIAVALLYSIGSVNPAHAVPFEYQATYVVTSIGGLALPSAWEGVKSGDEFTVLMTWDADAATRYGWPGSYTPYYHGPLTNYVISFGGDSIASRPIETNRSLRGFWGEESQYPRDILYLEDSDPTFTVAGYVDEVYFFLTCPHWASLSNLPTSLSCGGDLAGMLRFSSPYGEFGVTADLREMGHQVPEPDTLVLVSIGLLGFGLNRRLKTK